jgi:hypothetical protein
VPRWAANGFPGEPAERDAAGSSRSLDQLQRSFRDDVKSCLKAEFGDIAQLLAREVEINAKDDAKHRKFFGT